MPQLRSFGLVVLAAAVGLAVGCGPGNPTKPDDPKGNGGDPPVPLLNLLAQLPKDRWPKDEKDTLQVAKATEWYDKNAAGRRVTWTVPKRSELRFDLDKKSGKYSVTIPDPVQKVELFEREWDLHIFVHATGAYTGLKVGGLTESTAERLRATAADQPLELALTVGDIVFSEGVKVRLKNTVAIKGFSE